jgi:XTP/dITP diphosphohydrolase
MTGTAREIVLASGNPGKIRELRELLGPTGIRVRSQAEFGVTEVPETGLTFVENALIKARHAAHCTRLPAVADDSGLEVDALGGAPGIYSARYAGENADDRENVAKLLEAMRTIPREQRSARFQCIIVFMKHEADPTPVICHGTWEGSILSAPRGDNGFGYDPLFEVPELGLSAAQLDAGTKNRLSHRGKALAQLKQSLAP